MNAVFRFAMAGASPVAVSFLDRLPQQQHGQGRASNESPDHRR